ncbi:MAG: antibiotic biosynthesis monooxygenase [Halobacteriota archaeon]
MSGTRKTNDHADSGPVTVIIRRRIKLGFAKAYEQLEKEISTDASAYPGYLGCTFLHPKGGDRDFVTIVRFASFESMLQWEYSATGSALIDRADAMSELPALISRNAGLSLWFNPHQPASPQRWKMVLLLAVSIFVLAQLLTPLLNPALRLLPQPLAFFISLIIQVALLTYFVLPRLTALLAKWLYDVPRVEE